MAPSKKKNVCIDFDGVIHRYSLGWKDGSIYDSPVEGSLDALANISKAGYRIVIFTTRLNPSINQDIGYQYRSLKAWLKKHGFRRGQHFHELTAMKPQAHVYIDDRALRFTSWIETLHFFK